MAPLRKATLPVDAQNGVCNVLHGAKLPSIEAGEMAAGESVFSTHRLMTLSEAQLGDFVSELADISMQLRVKFEEELKEKKLNKEEYPHECLVCHDRFKTNTALRSHKSRKHTQVEVLDANMEYRRF